MQRSFGPCAVEKDDGTVTFRCRSSATYCFLLHSNTCSDQKPPRDLDDPPMTPEWCKYLAGAKRDYADWKEMDRLGLRDMDRADLSPLVKALPVEYRGTDPMRKKPWRLNEMNAEMMRHALLAAHRAGAWDA